MRLRKKKTTCGSCGKKTRRVYNWLHPEVIVCGTCYSAMQQQWEKQMRRFTGKDTSSG